MMVTQGLPSGPTTQRETWRKSEKRSNNGNRVCETTHRWQRRRHGMRVRVRDDKVGEGLSQNQEDADEQRGGDLGHKTVSPVRRHAKSTAAFLPGPIAHCEKCTRFRQCLKLSHQHPAPPAQIARPCAVHGAAPLSDNVFGGLQTRAQNRA